MAFLQSTANYTACDVPVKVRIIPDGAKSTKNIYVGGKLVISAGGSFKAGKKLTGGKPTKVTIHNTEDITPATGTTKSEQYSRACWPNQNLADVRVHYFVDEVEAWQNLADDEVAWHAGSAANATSLSIEIIGSGAKAEDNGARLAAYLLHKHGLSISDLTTHKAWTGKYCPAYILPHWQSFVALVKKYLAQAVKASAAPKSTSSSIVYKSLGVARIRTAPSLSGTEMAKCAIGGHYAMTRIVTTEGGDKWLGHINGGYSALTDTDGTALFAPVGIYRKAKTNAPCIIRKNALITSTRVAKLTAGTEVILLPGGDRINGGIRWTRVIYCNAVCWADSQWIS